MSSQAYTSSALVSKLYGDQSRIASRGAFLKAHSNRRYSIRDLLRMLLAGCPRQTVLDYGCGNGSFLRSILDDPEIRRAYAQDVVRHDDIATLPETVIYVDASGIPFDIDTKVDVIFCMNVLYHLDREAIADFLRRADMCLNTGGSLFVTTKSINNFPVFRGLLDDLGLEYGPLADEANFSIENALDQIEAVLLPAAFEIVEYPLVTQIITPNADAVLHYMLSCERFSGVTDKFEQIREKILEKPLFIDSYFETVLHAKKGHHDE